MRSPRGTRSRSPEDQEALAESTEAIRLDPRNAGAYSNRNLVKAELGRHDEGLADLEQATRLDPDMTSTLGDL